MVQNATINLNCENDATILTHTCFPSCFVVMCALLNIQSKIQLWFYFDLLMYTVLLKVISTPVLLNISQTITPILMRSLAYGCISSWLQDGSPTNHITFSFHYVIDQFIKVYKKTFLLLDLNQVFFTGIKELSKRKFLTKFQLHNSFYIWERELFPDKNEPCFTCTPAEVWNAP